jgi:hypothetical protein
MTYSSRRTVAAPQRHKVLELSHPGKNAPHIKAGGQADITSQISTSISSACQISRSEILQDNVSSLNQFSDLTERFGDTFLMTISF